MSSASLTAGRHGPAPKSASDQRLSLILRTNRQSRRPPWRRSHGDTQMVYTMRFGRETCLRLLGYREVFRMADRKK